MFASTLTQRFGLRRRCICRRTPSAVSRTPRARTSPQWFTDPGRVAPHFFGMAGAGAACARLASRGRQRRDAYAAGIVQLVQLPEVRGIAPPSGLAYRMWRSVMRAVALYLAPHLPERCRCSLDGETGYRRASGARLEILEKILEALFDLREFSSQQDATGDAYRPARARSGCGVYAFPCPTSSCPKKGDSALAHIPAGCCLQAHCPSTQS